MRNLKNKEDEKPIESISKVLAKNHLKIKLMIEESSITLKYKS